MNEIPVQCLSAGEVEANLVVSPVPLSFWGGFNVMTGAVIDRGHPAFGQVLTGRILAMGMGRPLEPGTYYVGIKNNNSPSTTMNYTLRSRGIGAAYTIPIVDLPFGGGAATNA